MNVQEIAMEVDVMRSSRRWDLWRVACGWTAAVAAGCWALKFGIWAVLVARYTHGAVDDKLHGPGLLVALVVFVLPTLGSLLGLIAGSGLVVPWVRSRRWFVGVPLAIVSAFVVTFVLSTVINASARLFDGLSSRLWTVEGTDLTAALLLAGLAAVLLAGPGRHSSQELTPSSVELIETEPRQA
jgi:hypothetical protein